MKYPGSLSHGPEEWVEFLARQANPKRDAPAFVARNFLLDQGIVAERVESYRELGCMTGHSSRKAWRGRHRAYLTERVYREAPIPALTLFDPADEDACPETFRFVDPSSPFLRSDPKIHLLRVERLEFVARESGEPADRVKELAESFLGSKESKNRRRLDCVLRKWTERIQVRPAFSAFMEDVLELFGETPTDDPRIGRIGFGIVSV